MEETKNLDCQGKFQLPIIISFILEAVLTVGVSPSFIQQVHLRKRHFGSNLDLTSENEVLSNCMQSWIGIRKRKFKSLFRNVICNDLAVVLSNNNNN